MLFAPSMIRWCARRVSMDVYVPAMFTCFCRSTRHRKSIQKWLQGWFVVIKFSYRFMSSYHPLLVHHLLLPCSSSGVFRDLQHSYIHGRPNRCKWILRLTSVRLTSHLTGPICPCVPLLSLPRRGSRLLTMLLYTRHANGHFLSRIQTVGM